MDTIQKVSLSADCQWSLCTDMGGMYKRELQFVGGSTSGKSSLNGGDQSLARNPLATSVPYPSNMDISKYIDAAVWLNNTIDIKDWCNASNTFYFRHQKDAVLFKLRYME
jgi:hypothetical protein